MVDLLGSRSGTCELFGTDDGGTAVRRNDDGRWRSASSGKAVDQALQSKPN